MFESLRNHMSYGFSALEEFLYPSEDEKAVEPINVKIRDISIESGLFDPKTGKWLEGAGVLFPCGHDFSINTYNNLWFWFSQKAVAALSLVFSLQKKRLSEVEKTNTAFAGFQNKCRVCKWTADRIIPNYALRDMIDILKESISKESSKVQDVWERNKDLITLAQMKDPIIQAPCGHSICATVWNDPTFESFKSKCQECKQNCETFTKNTALNVALKVLNNHYLDEMDFPEEELAKLSQENLWNAREVCIESPENLLFLRDAAISIEALSVLAPFIQTTILRKPDHFIRLLNGAELSMDEFSALSIFDQAVILAADYEYGERWLKTARQL